MPSLDKQLFELRFAAKSLERASHKSTRLMGEEKAKVLKDMQRNNPEGARIHAEAAVRHQHESLQLLKLSNRVDAMASQLTGAMKMRGINDSMAKVVDLLCRAVEGERLVEMTKVMDDFERQMDNVRVQGACMDAALGSAVASTTPPDEVNALMQQVADAHGLQIAQAMPAPSLAASQDFATATASPSSDPLAERLAKLRS